MSAPAPLRAQSRFSAVPDWITFHPDLSAYAVRLYSGLMRFADRDTGVAFPGRDTLASKLHMSERTVDNAVKELVAAGALLARARWRDTEGIHYSRGRGRTQTSTEYTILVVAQAPEVGTQVPMAHAQPPHEMRTPPHTQPPHEMQANDRTTTTSLNEKTPRPDYTADFTEFWKAYPKREGKPKAAEAYRKARAKVDHQAIMASLASYRFSPDPTYIPWPQKWLRDEHWQDEPSTAPVAAARPAPKAMTSAEIIAKRQQGIEETYRRLAELEERQAMVRK